jgi:hypothetical protein
MFAILLLVARLFSSKSSEEVKVFRQENIKFCREQTYFVPLDIVGLRAPPGFPAHYVEAIDKMQNILYESVLVREVSKEMPNLWLGFKLQTEKDERVIAHAFTDKRDRCGRPRTATIFWSNKYLALTKDQFSLVLLHEIMHLMGGFGSDDAPYYYLFGKQNTKELGLIYGHIKPEEGNFYAVSPGVQEEVKKETKLIRCSNRMLRTKWSKLSTSSLASGAFRT